MRVAFLIPRVHIAACKVVQHWLLDDARGESLILTTPKLASAQASPISKARAILKESGFWYLWNQVQMTRSYQKAARRELQADLPLHEQRFPSPDSLAKIEGVQRIEQRSIKSKAAREALQAFAPDVMVAIFFNQIVGPKALAIPRLAALNVHPSLLPAYRGISPVFRVLLGREPRTGASVHAMREKIDFGDLYAQAGVEIRASDTYFGLYQKVADAAGEALAEVL
ncbi:MAG: hypothetical protein KDB07_04835, partial [Planctomycetes bacterium]|nr:hypothetical protein [Planctomycetota bacterium]